MSFCVRRRRSHLFIADSRRCCSSHRLLFFQSSGSIIGSPPPCFRFFPFLSSPLRIPIWYLAIFKSRIESLFFHMFDFFSLLGGKPIPDPLFQLRPFPSGFRLRAAFVVTTLFLVRFCLRADLHFRSSMPSSQERLGGHCFFFLRHTFP